MANLFDRPIAANPLSQFVELPLAFLNQAVERRQNTYDKAKALMDSERDDLLKTRSSAANSERHKALLQEYEAGLDDIVDKVGGDYSMAKPYLESYTRKLKKELSYGELGAINDDYGRMEKEKTELDKQYADGKIGKAGYDKAMRIMSEYKTQLTPQNTWSVYRGYVPSNVTDVYSALNKAADEVKEQYLETGEKEVTGERIIGAVTDYLKSKPETMQALQEEFESRYTGDAKNYAEEFKKYSSNVIQGVVQNKRYREYFRETDEDKRLRKQEKEDEETRAAGGTSMNWQMPRVTGIVDYKEGGAPYLKAAASYLGIDTTAGHDKWVASSEGQQTIKALEASSGTKFPKGYLDQTRWLTKNINQPRTANVTYRGVTQKEERAIVTDKGFLNYPNAAMYKKGSSVPLSADEIREMQGTSPEGNVTRVVGYVTQGYPYGSKLIIGKDGEEYIQEPADSKTLSSSEFNEHLIDAAVRTNTQKDNVTLRGDIRDAESGKVAVPRGSYEVRKAEGTNRATLYQNGIPKYLRHYVRNANGDMELEYRRVGE